ncbi:hypothetical protein [Streptomyces sp. JB150]|uniref:hypothetical protein n=1 Tax=Streptomyces sp. JB150 TaxID=2714844 RepID=UPI00140C3296|nr:hypothetical protein [Streptomyces sp. JB150]QIJ61462.1 hypothetical protein G7Z13_04975 [Streptomyces sp. JB150]
MPQSSQTTVFVVMNGDIPRSVAADLATAQASALARQTAWSGTDKWDYRWDEYLPGEVWRLMQRRKGPEGKGRRYSWSMYAVHAVEFLGGAR